MVACFDADWEHKEFKPQPDSPLIWCPNNGRQRMAAFIDATQHTLWLQNERYQDQVIIERLVRAVRRGVKVHILAKPPHSLKPDKLIEGVGGLRILQDVGAKVHTLEAPQAARQDAARRQQARHHRLDQHRARQLRRAARTRDRDRRPEVAKRLEKVAQHDWDQSHPLDLSDAALLADLKKREGLDPDKLVLYEDSEHWGYHHNGHHGKNHDKGTARALRIREAQTVECRIARTRRGRSMMAARPTRRSEPIGLPLPVMPPERDPRLAIRVIRVMFYVPGFIALLLLKTGEPTGFGITIEFLMLASAASVVAGLFVATHSTGAPADTASKVGLWSGALVLELMGVVSFLYALPTLFHQLANSELLHKLVPGAAPVPLGASELIPSLAIIPFMLYQLAGFGTLALRGLQTGELGDQPRDPGARHRQLRRQSRGQLRHREDARRRARPADGRHRHLRRLQAQADADAVRRASPAQAGQAPCRRGPSRGGVMTPDRLGSSVLRQASLAASTGSQGQVEIEPLRVGVEAAWRGCIPAAAKTEFPGIRAKLQRQSVRQPLVAQR